MSELNKANVADILPLTSAQAGMLFHTLVDKKEGVSYPAYNQQLCFRLLGQLDIERFSNAWQRLIDRHDSLRAIYKHDKAAQPLQLVLKVRKFNMGFFDLSTFRASEQVDRLKALQIADRQNAFNLDTDIPIRITLVRMAPNEHWVLWAFHHICMDGWCVGLLQKELFHFYQNPNSQQQKLLLPVSLTQFAHWYKTQIHNVDFWSGYLSGFTASTKAPLPTLRSGGISNESPETGYSVESLIFTGNELQHLRQLAAQSQATLSTVIHCLWGVYLAKVNGVKDVVFGTTQSLRSLEQGRFEQLVGLCLNTLPCRITLTSDECFGELVARVQPAMSLLGHHAISPLADIQSLSTKAGPLFDHFIAFENFPSTPVSEDGVEHLTNDLSADSFSEFMPTSYAFHLAVLPSQERLEILFKYAANKVDKLNIIAIRNSFSALTIKLLKMPQEPINAINLCANPVTSANKWCLQNKSLDAQWSSYLAGKEHDIALVAGQRSLTYSQLLDLSNKLASKIALCSDQQPVAIYAEPDLETVVAMFACFRIGVPYVPIGPAITVSQVDSILKEAGCKLMLFPNMSTTLSVTVETSFVVDFEALKHVKHHDIDRKPQLSDIAYLIFTSGTTGQPKGVPVFHSSLLNYLHWIKQKLQLSQADSSVLLTAFNFDLGYTAVFGTLFCGGQLYLASEAQRRDPQWVKALIRANAITFLKITPSYLNMLIASCGHDFFHGSTLTRLVLGGEGLRFNDIAAIRQHSPDINFYNHYGPTENTIGSCAKALSDVDITLRYQNIGQPADGVKLAVFTEDGQLLPPYVKGELCLSGAQLFDGYWGRPDNSCFFDVDGVRWYKTGDKAYLNYLNECIFVSRAANIVKVDGHRIDLKSIDAVMKAQPEIADCVTLAYERNDNTSIIVTLVIMYSDNLLCVRTLKKRLSQHLPVYAIPADIIAVSRFPLTDNGKLDERELAGFWRQRLNLEPVGQRDPETPTEKVLESIWQKLFAKDAVGIDTDFFALGGHSIKSIMLSSEVRKALNVTLPVNAVFSFPTIHSLARAIDNGSFNEPSEDIITPLHSASGEKSMVIYCMPSVLGTATMFKELFSLVDAPVQAFGVSCQQGQTAQQPNTLNSLARRIAKQIRTYHSRTDASQQVILLGYSFGGVLALEVSRYLPDLLHDVPLLIIDTHLDPAQNITQDSLAALKQMPYWQKVIEIMQSQMTSDEFAMLDTTLRHNQKLLRDYLSTLDFNQARTHSPLVCIEAIGNQSRGYMAKFDALTTGKVSILPTPGDHYSMFQPPHVSHLLTNFKQFIDTTAK